VSDREWALGLARRFRPVGILDREDYDALALCAVWLARERYTGGVKFRTFAYRYVTGAILRAMRDTSGVPAYLYERGVRMDAAALPADWDGVSRYREWQPEDMAVEGETTALVDALPLRQRQAVRHVVYGERRAVDQPAAMYMARKRLRERLCENY
jgi:DNA-directed RNA polymerase specialized sigma24 family protein